MDSFTLGTANQGYLIGNKSDPQTLAPIGKYRKAQVESTKWPILTDQMGNGLNKIITGIN